MRGRLDGPAPFNGGLHGNYLYDVRGDRFLHPLARRQNMNTRTLVVLFFLASLVTGYAQGTRLTVDLEKSYQRPNGGASSHGTISAVLELTSFNATSGLWSVTLTVTGTFTGPDASYGTARCFYQGINQGATVGPSTPTAIKGFTAAPGQKIQSFGASLVVGGQIDSPLQELTVPHPNDIKKVTLSLRNQKDYPVRYKLMQDGAQVGSITLGAGDAVIQTFTVPTGSLVEVYAEVDGLTRDGPSWVAVEGAITEQRLAGLIPESGTGTPPATVIPEPDTPKQKPVDEPTPGSGSQTSKPVWENPIPNNDPQDQKDLLTNPVYRQGVDKVVGGLSRLEQAIKDSQNSTQIDLSGVEQRLDAIKEKMPEKASADDISESQILSAFTSGKAQVSAAWETAAAEWKGGTPQQAGAVQLTPSGGVQWPQFTLPIVGLIKFDPYEKFPWIITLFNWTREILLWLLVYGFIRLRVYEVNDYSMRLATAPQVQTSIAAQDLVPVAGQFGSWLKGSLSVIGIVTVVGVTVGIVVGLVNTEMVRLVGTGMKTAVEGTSALQTLVASVAGTYGPAAGKLLLELFPLAATLQLFLAEIVLVALQGPIWSGAALLIRVIRG